MERAELPYAAGDFHAIPRRCCTTSSGYLACKQLIHISFCCIVRENDSPTSAWLLLRQADANDVGSQARFPIDQRAGCLRFSDVCPSLWWWAEYPKFFHYRYRAVSGPLCGRTSGIPPTTKTDTSEVLRQRAGAYVTAGTSCIEQS